MTGATLTPEDPNDEAGDALIAITRRTGRRSFNQQRRAYEAWLAKYAALAEAQGRSEDVPRLRRLVAEWLITEAVVARRPARAFEPLVRDVEALGWEDLFQKDLKIGVICGYFAQRMWKREALRYLVPHKREVEEAYARTGDRTWAMALEGIADLERRLRSRKRPF